MIFVMKIFFGGGGGLLSCFVFGNTIAGPIDKVLATGSVAKHTTIFSWQGFRPFTSGFEPLYGTKQDLCNWAITLADNYENLTSMMMLQTFLPLCFSWKRQKSDQTLKQLGFSCSIKNLHHFSTISSQMIIIKTINWAKWWALSLNWTFLGYI